MSTSGYLCMFLLVGLVFVPTNGWHHHQCIIDEIDHLEGLFRDYVAQNDTAALIKMYHDNATYLAVNHEILKGHEAIGSTMEWVDDTARQEVTDYEVLPMGSSYANTVYNEKDFSVGGDVIFDGKHTRTWKKTPHGWKIYIEAFNTNEM